MVISIYWSITVTSHKPHGNSTFVQACSGWQKDTRIVESFPCHEVFMIKIWEFQSKFHSPWWRHQLEAFSALLAIAGNSPGTGDFPAQRPVTRSFDVLFYLRLNKWLSKQSWGWWFETLSRPLWRYRNDNFKVRENIKRQNSLIIPYQYYIIPTAEKLSVLKRLHSSLFLHATTVSEGGICAKLVNCCVMVLHILE